MIRVEIFQKGAGAIIVDLFQATNHILDGARLITRQWRRSSFWLCLSILSFCRQKHGIKETEKLICRSRLAISIITARVTVKLSTELLSIKTDIQRFLSLTAQTLHPSVAQHHASALLPGKRYVDMGPSGTRCYHQLPELTIFHFVSGIQMMGMF